jgi:hypothetical protein
MMSEMRIEFWPKQESIAPIAFVTMARDEEAFLSSWIENGRKICPDAAFYVLDHASVRPLSHFAMKYLSSNGVDISVFRIPSVPFDDDFKSMALSSLAKSLLHCYEVVVTSDCDELLVGFGIRTKDILPKLRAASGVIAPIGFEVVQHLEKEKPFDPSAPVQSQRNYGFFASGYTKPVIWKKRTEFGAGLHRTRDGFSYDVSLGLLHLRSVDASISEERAAQRRSYSLSESQVMLGRGANWQRQVEKKIDFFSKVAKMEDIQDAGSIMDDFLKNVRDSYEKNIGGFWGHNISINSDYCNISNLLKDD